MLTCPNDGAVEVTIENVASVFLREPDLVEVAFECPICGESIGVSATVPHLLAAAIEALSIEEEDDRRVAGFFVAAHEEGVRDGSPPSDDIEMIEAYCEYFRRELDLVECVDDALRQIDSR